MDKVAVRKRKNIPFYANEQAFIQFVNRVTQNKYGKYVHFHLVESNSGFDEYTLSVKNGIIDIQATSGTAGGAAFNAYLRKYCRYYYGFLTQGGELPEIPPDTTENITESSAFHYRYAFNYCTFGYTYAFSTWEEWEKVTDCIILSGYNLVLNPIGNECVWVEVLQKFGYTKEEAKKYISAPNYLPWQWMMNLSSFDSMPFDFWYEEQKEISRKFTKKLKDFGIGVMFPGYCGAVPDDFVVKNPQASVVNQGEWFGFIRPAILIPDEENGVFERVAKTYYDVQKEILQADNVRYYSADPFHEGGEKGTLDLVKYAKTVLSCMKSGNEDAVWSFQGWLSNPDRKMIAALNAEDTLILNMQADKMPDGGDDFLGHPHVYSVVNNFGGQQRCLGSASWTYHRAHKLACDTNSACCGVGLLPEGVECDEMLFDIIAEISVRKNLRDKDEFLREYALSRYGIVNDDIIKALKILFDEIYIKDFIGNNIESGLLARPSLNVNRVGAWSGTANVQANEVMNQKLLKIVQLLLNNFESCKEREGFIFDLIAMIRQAVANESWKYIYGINAAFQEKNKQALLKNARALFTLFDLQIAIVDCDKNLNLQLYLDKAMRRGKTEEEKRWLRTCSLRLITTWHMGPSALHDYAAREYGDMLRYFNKPKWEKHVALLLHSLDGGKPLEEYDYYAFDVDFISKNIEYNRDVSKDVYTSVESAFRWLTKE